MADPTPLLLNIIDESGTLFPVGKVTLTLGSAPVVKTAAPFAFELSAAASGTLVIEKTGHHTFSFALDVKETGGDFTASFSATMVDRPRMASLAKVAATGPAVGPGQNLLTVIIGTVQEIVLVAGYDYHSGTNFRALWTQRMHDIATAAAITDSTVVTVFEMQTGEITRWVRGTGKEKLGQAYRWSAGWSRMTVENRPTPNLDQKKSDYPGPGVMGIAEVLSYVQDVGRLRPGTVQEFSILGHSYIGGPILFDTFEHAEFKPGGAQEKARDPADKDGRYRKDFNSTNMPDIAVFKAAFAATSLVKIWGCFAVEAFRNMINAARTATSDTQVLGIPVDDRTGLLAPVTVFPDNRPGVIAYFRQDGFKANYMFQLSQAIGRPVFGGPPGMGALFLSTAFGLRMYIPARQLSIKAGKIVEGAVIYQREIDFLKSTYGSTFDATNYLLYPA